MMYPISKEYSERLNILKVLLIIMVVFIHSYSGRGRVNFADGNIVMDVPIWLETIKYAVSQSISETAVPLFFLISSILLYSKNFSWKSNMKKKIKTLVIPYLIWNSFWLLFFFVAQSFEITAPFFSNPDNYIRDFGMIEYLSAFTGLKKGIISAPILYPLWFLRDLFFINLLSIIIKRIIDKVPFIVLCLILILWFSDVPMLGNSRQTIVFFLLGYYMVKYKMDISITDNLNIIELSTGYVILLMMDTFLRTYIIHNFCVLYGIVYFTMLSKKINACIIIKKIFLFLSPYVFIIYVFHEMNLTIMKKLLTRILPHNSFVQLILYFGIPVFIILLCALFGHVLRRYTKVIYNVVTGNR